MKKFAETGTLRGVFEMRVYKSGKIIEKISDNNLVLNIAKIQMANLLAGNTANRHITQIAFGTNNTDPEPSDSVITGQWSKPVSGYSFPLAGSVRFNWQLGDNENNGMAIREFGLLTADGQLFARKTRTNPIHKASDISLEGHWTIMFLSQ